MRRDPTVGDNAQSAPIYLQLIQSLKERIQSGAYSRTGKLESENELCALFDCSRPTVRKALSALISEGQIRKYPKKGYFLNKTLTPGRTRAKTLAVLANLENDVTNFQSYPLLVQLNNLADIYGFQLQFHYFNQALDILHFLAQPPEGLSAALVFRPPQSWVDSLVRKSDFLRKKGLPFVVIDRNLGDAGIHYCTSDFAQPVRDGLKYLSQLGHRRVGLILGDIHTIYNIDIHRSFKESTKKLGMEYDPCLFCEILDLNLAAMANKIEEFLSPPLNFSALIVTGGYYLRDTLAVLDKQGIRVPRDLSLILNCQVYYTENSGWNITTFQQPVNEVCKRCFEALRMILGGNSEGTFRETIPFSFVFGDTCAPMKNR